MVEQPSTILVADDEEPLLRLCSRLLERKGYAVLPARDGDEVVRVFAQHGEAIHTLVLDATLPPDGAASALAALGPQRADLALICIGGDAPGGRLRELIEQRDGIFLAKPFPGDALVRAVAKHHPLGGD
jgi:DNA-binding NtrC family response regulator